MLKTGLRNIFIAAGISLVLIAAISMHASATDYYFSASGSDAAAGTSPGTAWQTIAKFNSVFATRSPGDRMLFKSGDTFYGSMIISRSGSAGNQITIGSYEDIGTNPVITGFTTVSAWTNLGSNIWESTSAVSTLADLNMVTINGVNTPMGRYPNSGYLTYTRVSNTSVSQASLNSAVTNWTGADVVMKVFAFVMQRNSITGHSGNTLTYIQESTTNSGITGYGLFIEDDARTLDVQNEWYYNPTTKKIRIYSTSSPTNVKVASVDNLVTLTGKGFITFDGVDFTGSNKRGFFIGSSPNTIIQNCNIDFHGLYAIWGGNNFGSAAPNLNINHNTINHVNSQAIVLQNEFSAPYIGYNIIKNEGVFPGMFKKDGTQFPGAFGGIVITNVHNIVIEYNVIDSTGYNGIGIFGTCNNARINNNEVAHACLILMDGAGIYAWVGTSDASGTASRIYSNIVRDGVGENAGTLNTGQTQVMGIYLDEGVRNMEVYDNSCFNNDFTGIFSNSNQNCDFHDNTLYNNDECEVLVASEFIVLSSNNKLENNICVARTALQKVVMLSSNFNDITTNPMFSEIDNNYYARPIDDNLTMDITYNTQSSPVFLHYNLAQWKAYFSPKDQNSQKSPLTISNVNDLRFEYNATSSPAIRSLPFNYMDVRGVTYNGTITLQPYTSAVLIKNGAIIGGDDEAPSQPTGYSATGVSPSQINLVWSASTDNVGVTGYNIYRDNVYIITVGTLSYSDVGLTASTTYTYKIQAEDAAANVSTFTPDFDGTTLTPAPVIIIKIRRKLKVL